MAFRVGAAKNLPVKDGAFDAAGAKSRMFDRATADDQLNPTQARQGFGIYDDADPTLRGAYHLPFADVVNGELTAIGNGVRNALSRLPQLQGCPQAVQDECQNVLEGYMQKLNPDYQPSTTKALTPQAGPLPVGATEILVAARIATLRATPTTDDLLAAAMASAPDPTVFTEAPPYFVSSVISTNSLDAYGTIMAKSTLQNFANDAADGRAVLVGHDNSALPIGYSLTGQYKDGRHNGVASGEAHVASDAYLVPGTGTMGSPADMVIRGIRAGTTRDVSVGFFGGSYRCSLCDRAFGDLACEHIPGLMYLLSGRADPASEGASAALLVHDAHLAEYSFVFDGATPGAGVQKARMLSAAGQMRPEWAERVDLRWGVRVAAAPPSWTLGAVARDHLPAGAAAPVAVSPAGPPPPGPVPMEVSVEFDDLIRSVATDAGLQPHDDLAVTIRALGAELASLRAQAAEVPTLRARVDELTPLADQGRAYRAALVTSALAEGVRAFGADFAEETYRGLLEAAPLETIQRMTADWGKLAAQQFPGGRVTQDQAEPPPAPVAAAVPNAAFAG